MIYDIDKSSVIEGTVIDSPVMGKIPPTSLSGGVKTLILIANEPEKIFNASTCGDNCAKPLLKKLCFTLEKRLWFLSYRKKYFILTTYFMRPLFAFLPVERVLKGERTVETLNLFYIFTAQLFQWCEIDIVSCGNKILQDRNLHSQFE